MRCMQITNHYVHCAIEPCRVRELVSLARPSLKERARGGHSGTYYRYVRDRGQDAVKRSKLLFRVGQAVKGVDGS